MPSSAATLSQDDVFDLLSNSRRRFVINYLLRVDRAVSIQELSRELAMWEFDATAEELTDQEEKRIYVALYQTHVPKLEEAGIVDYDTDTGLIQLDEQATELQPYVEEDLPGSRSWPLYYAGLAAAGLAVYAGVLLGVPPLGAANAFLVGVGAVIALLGLATAHYLSSR